jgi:hypothetical protein
MNGQDRDVQRWKEQDRRGGAGRGGTGYCMLGQDMKEQHSIGQDRGVRKG